MAAEREQRAGRDVARVRAERDGLQKVGRVADGAADHDRNLVADALVAQALVNRRERQLNGDADVVADAGRGRARAAAVAVDADDVRARARHARGDGRDIMYGRNLDQHRLFVLGRFLERKDELAQVLDGVDVVVRGRGNGVRALGDHAGARDVRADLVAGQVAADAGLCALAHFNLDSRARLQIVLMHAEAAGRDLHDGVRAVLVEVLVQAALAGVVVGAERAGRAGKRLVRVVGDRAVAHGREHDRHAQLELGRQVGYQVAVRVALDFARLFAEEGPRLHGLAQRVDGGVGDLGGVDEDLIPVNGVRLRIAHGGEQHAARASLAVDLGDGLARPVGVFLKGMVGLDNLQRARRTKGDAAMAGDALGLVDHHLLEFRVVEMHLVGALPLARAAGDAAVVIAHDLILRIQKVDSHYCFPPSCRLTITGSPPRGAQMWSSVGSMARMAHSSDAMYTVSPFSPTTIERSFKRSLRAIRPPV